MQRLVKQRQSQPHNTDKMRDYVCHLPDEDFRTFVDMPCLVIQALFPIDEF